MGTALLRALRPAVPAVIGAAALTFLFAAVIPMTWVAGISWNLYLDRLSDLFVPPVGNAARLALALGMAAIASLIAAFVALVLARPDAAGFGALRRGRRAAAETDDGDVLVRRRADFHPDDPPRPPIRAGRDLPAEGLGPLTAPGGDEEAFELSAAGDVEPREEELVLADLAPAFDPEPATGNEPWLQPAEIQAGPVMSDPADRSLGAMVARFEAGLARRRHGQAVSAATAAIAGGVAPAGDETGNDDAGEVDFALEAALGTLQRMNRHAVG